MSYLAIEHAAYSRLNDMHKENLKEIILSNPDHDKRWRALREYCNCNLFEERLNTYILTLYLERLYL